MSGHDHDHHHDPVVLPDTNEGLDEGSKALADAFRSVFVVLKVIMLCVVALLVYNGVFTVESNEQAVVLQFGKVKGGTTSKAVLGPGWHWKWPDPIEEVIMIPAEASEQHLNINDFWYFEGTPGRPSRPGRNLQFVRDGYTLTASRPAGDMYGSLSGISENDADNDHATDYNIMHSQWRIRYNITDPVAYVKNIWLGDECKEAVEKMLRCALADVVILSSANQDIEWLIWNKAEQFRPEVEKRFQDRLTRLGVGISAKLDLVPPIPPRQVQADFDKAARAGIEAKRLRTDAHAQAEEIVNASRADAVNILAKADTYRTMIVQSAQADAQYMSVLLDEVDQAARQRVPDGTPDQQKQRREVGRELLAIAIDQLYQEAIREILSNADEVFVLNADEDANVEWRPILSRDAMLKAQPAKQAGKQLYTPSPTAPSGPPKLPPGP